MDELWPQICLVSPMSIARDYAFVRILLAVVTDYVEDMRRVVFKCSKSCLSHTNQCLKLVHRMPIIIDVVPYRWRSLDLLTSGNVLRALDVKVSTRDLWTGR